MVTSANIVVPVPQPSPESVEAGAPQMAVDVEAGAPDESGWNTTPSQRRLAWQLTQAEADEEAKEERLGSPEIAEIAQPSNVEMSVHTKRKTSLTPLVPSDEVSPVEEDAYFTPCYFADLQRTASCRRQKSTEGAGVAAGRVKSTTGTGRVRSTEVAARLGSRVVSVFSKRVSSIGVKDAMLQHVTVQRLRQFPMLSNETANTLQGYQHCDETNTTSRVDQGPWQKLALIPIVSFLPIFLYAIPTSWGPEAKANGSIWETWVLWPPILVVTTALFPLWISSWSQIEYRSKKIFFIYFGITWGIVGTCATLAPLWVSDMIAVPFVKIFQAAVFLLYLGVSVIFGMKPEQRKEKSVFKRAAIGLIVSMSVIVVFAFIYPLLNIAFLKTKSGLVQFGIAIAFWALSSAYVMGLNMVAKRERPDMYPVIAYLSVFFYNFFLSSVFSAIQSWYIFATFLILDIAESAWFCYLASSAVQAILESECEEEEAARRENELTAVTEEGSPVPAPQRAATMVTKKLHVKIVNRCLCVLSLPVAKLLAAILAPVLYVGSMFLLRETNPKMNGAFTFITDAQVELGILYIGIHVFCEALLFVVLRIWVKRHCGMDMWLIARGVCHLFFYEIITCQWTAVMCYLALQWAPGGVDWAFNFNYLKDGATWQGGMCWTLDGAGIEACNGVLGAS